MKNRITNFVFISIVTIFVCGCNRSNPVETFNSQPTPAAGAFGWNLGDKLPDSAQIEINNDSFSLSHSFTPDKPLLNSDLMYELDVTADHTIYAISALGFVHDDDVKVQRDALVQALKEKYDIRQHVRNSALMDAYDFGTADRSVELTVSQEGTYPFLSLTYTDSSLHYKAEAEDNQRKAAAKNSLSEDLKKQGL